MRATSQSLCEAKGVARIRWWARQAVALSLPPRQLRVRLAGPELTGSVAGGLPLGAPIFQRFAEPCAAFGDARFTSAHLVAAALACLLGLSVASIASAELPWSRIEGLVPAGAKAGSTIQLRLSGGAEET